MRVDHTSVAIRREDRFDAENARTGNTENTKPLLRTAIESVSRSGNGSSKCTGVALALTGVAMTIGYFIHAVTRGNPMAGLVAFGGAAPAFINAHPVAAIRVPENRYSGADPGILERIKVPENLDFIKVAKAEDFGMVPQTFPVPARMVAELVSAESLIDKCPQLVELMRGINEAKIDAIVLRDLWLVRSEIEKANELDLATLTSSQLVELGECFGTDLMAGQILPLKNDLETVKNRISNGDTQSLMGVLSSRFSHMFHAIGVVRERALLKEVNPRLEAVNDIYGKALSFVQTVNNRIVANRG